MPSQTRTRNRKPGEKPRPGAMASAPPAGIPHSFKILLGALALLGAVLVAYLPAMNGAFVWDDNLLITENPLITDAPSPAPIWTSAHSMDYTPLTLTTFWMEWRLFHHSALGFHLVNLLLHAGAAFLIWRILERLKIPGGWLAALLFAIHPVNAASAAWIAERKNTLSLFFYLLSILCYLEYQLARNWRLYGAAVLAAICAFLSKGSTVVLPLVLLGVVRWRQRRITRADLFSTAPFFLLAAIFAVITVHYQAVIITKSLAQASLPYRIVRAGEAICFYLWKDVFPIDLCPIYPKWPIQPESPVAWLPVAGIVALMALFWWKRQGWGRAWLFAFGYYLAGLLPVLGFANMGFMDQVNVADWWQEIAIIGPLALAAAGVAIASKRLPPGGRYALQAGTALAVLLLGWATWSQAATYRTQDSFWEHALALNPNSWEVHDNYGNALSTEGRTSEAIAQYKAALRITQNYPNVFYNFANVLRRTGQVDAAIANYQRAIQIEPNYKEAHNNLGVAFKMKGRLDDAATQYQSALSIDPDYAEAHDSYGVVLAAQGKIEAAIQEYQKALAINPGNPIAQQNLNSALASQKGMDATIDRAQAVLEAHRDDPEAFEAMADELTQHGFFSKAAQVYDEGIAAHAQDAHLLANDAWLLATCPDESVRNGETALMMASRAVHLSGGKDPTVLNPLAAAYGRLGRYPEAVSTAKQALELARQQGNSDLASLIGKELDNFSAQSPFDYP